MSNERLKDVEEARIECRRLLEFVREIRQNVPAPRGAPFYGLDGDLPFGFETLERLSSRGIFRKYEFVLMTGVGLGGAARWLAVRLGCRVVALEPRVEIAWFGRELSRRSHLEQVMFLAAEPEASSLTERAITHFWRIGGRGLSDAAIAETRRVLRPGGHFAVQGLPGESQEELEALAERLRRSGYEDVIVQDEAPVPIDQAIRLARRQFGCPADLADEALPRCWRLFALRPS